MTIKACYSIVFSSVIATFANQTHGMELESHPSKSRASKVLNRSYDDTIDSDSRKRRVSRILNETLGLDKLKQVFRVSQSLNRSCDDILFESPGTSILAQAQSIVWRVRSNAQYDFSSDDKKEIKTLIDKLNKKDLSHKRHEVFFTLFLNKEIKDEKETRILFYAFDDKDPYSQDHWDILEKFNPSISHLNNFDSRATLKKKGSVLTQKDFLSLASSLNSSNNGNAISEENKIKMIAYLHVTETNALSFIQSKYLSLHGFFNVLKEQIETTYKDNPAALVYRYVFSIFYMKTVYDNNKMEEYQKKIKIYTKEALPLLEDLSAEKPMTSLSCNLKHPKERLYLAQLYRLGLTPNKPYLKSLSHILLGSSEKFQKVEHFHKESRLSLRRPQVYNPQKGRMGSLRRRSIFPQEKEVENLPSLLNISKNPSH